jgi:hypothetical protein
MTFVAHPDGTVEDTRVFIDPTADTGFGPQIDAQAWAAGDPSVEPQPYREHHSWAAVARRAALALGVGIAAAGVVVTLGGFRSSASQPPTDPPSAVPASQDISTTIEMPPLFTMPPDVPVAHITHDGEYFQTLYRHGWEITDPPQALHAAQIVQQPRHCCEPPGLDARGAFGPLLRGLVDAALRHQHLARLDAGRHPVPGRHRRGVLLPGVSVRGENR